MFTRQQLLEKLFSLTNKRDFLIAYSGGLDSHVLLFALSTLRDEYQLNLRAVHVHHNLSKNADAWILHCARECEKLNIELIIKYIDASQFAEGKHSPEAFARELRYQALAEVIMPGECLLTAHHANDQAETLLLQLFRGCGAKGLAAMPAKKQFFQGEIIRPLLNYTRDELHNYAQKNKLKWIEDESNENIGIERNYVRHKLIPPIIDRWPGIIATLARSAEINAEQSYLIELLAKDDYEQSLGSRPNTLSIKKLLSLDSPRQKNVIRYWLMQLNFPLPNSIKLKHIQQDILNCRVDRMPIVHWPNVEIRKYRDNLYAMQSLTKFDNSLIFVWTMESPLKLPANLGVLYPDDIIKKYSIDLKSVKEVIIKFRVGGEKFKHIPGIGAKSLKNWFQEQGIEPWLRDRIPLLYINGIFMHPIV